MDLSRRGLRGLLDAEGWRHAAECASIRPAQIDSPRPPPTIAGEVSYVDDRIRLLRGRSIKTNQEVPTYFVFERVVDDSKGLSAAERAARSA